MGGGGEKRLLVIGVATPGVFSPGEDEAMMYSLESDSVYACYVGSPRATRNAYTSRSTVRGSSFTRAARRSVTRTGRGSYLQQKGGDRVGVSFVGEAMSFAGCSRYACVRWR